MLGGVFDPFSSAYGDYDTGDSGLASIYVGTITQHIHDTHSAMVLIPALNNYDSIGPCKIMQAYGASSHGSPSVGDFVVVAFIDGSLNNAIILGYIN